VQPGLPLIYQPGQRLSLRYFKIATFQKPHKMGNSVNTVKLIGALLLGSAVGGAIGVLFAPEKGSKTRRKLMTNSEDIVDVMTDKFSDFMDEIKKEVSSAAKNSANGMLDHTASKLEKFKTS
jgi:gas vesicle protein